MADHPPVTPSHHSHLSSRPTSKLQDSPFSDYFTDDGRSPESSAASAPSPATQQLLLRLNTLQSQLMRGETESSHDLLGIMERKVNEIETEMNSVNSQTRTMVELEDSGVFSDDEEDDSGLGDESNKSTVPAGQEQIHPSHECDDVFLHPEVTPENRRAEYDYLLLEAQRVLESVRKAESHLRARHAELRDLNDKYHVQVAEVSRRLDELNKDTEAADDAYDELWDENVELRKNLEFDETELLWLKLQFKALEVELKESDRGAERLEGYAPALRAEIQEIKRERWGRKMKGWEQDWKGIVRRFGGRRNEWSVLTEEDREGAGGSGSGVQDSAGEEWAIEMVKEEVGQAQRIILTKASSPKTSESVPTPHDSDTTEDVDPAINPPDSSDVATLRAPDFASYTNSSTQTTETNRRPSTASSWLLLAEEEEQGQEAAEADEEERSPIISPAADDCAITTCSEYTSHDEDDFSDLDDELPRDTTTTATTATTMTTKTKIPGPVKTAWQELWVGLTHLAGLGDEEEEWNQ